MLAAFKKSMFYARKSSRVKMEEEKNVGRAMESVVMCSVNILLA